MRGSTLILVLTLASSSNMCGLSESKVITPVSGPAASGLGMKKPAAKTSEATTVKIDFATQVKPILEARCRSCHFPRWGHVPASAASIDLRQSEPWRETLHPPQG